MSSERTEEQLDAMLATLRRCSAPLDEVTRARVGARLDAALAAALAPAASRKQWGRRRGCVVVGVGLAAAAMLVVVAVARKGAPPDTEVIVGEAPEEAAGPVAAAAGKPRATAGPGEPNVAVPAGTASVAASAGVADPAGAAKAARAASDVGAAATAPITVPAGESAQLTIGGAAVTIYGPGQLSPTSDGAVVEATGIVVDRARGTAPLSMRYHGVEIVATRATFAVDRGAGLRVTVMRGELLLRCPSGPRTVSAGASVTCDPAAGGGTSPAPPPRALAPQVSQAPAPERPEASPPSPEAPRALAPALAVPEEPAPAPALVKAAPQALTGAEAYADAERALRRGDLDAARDKLLAVIDAAPDSLYAATALFDLARLEASRGDTSTALVYLDRLSRHPHRGALAAPAARLYKVLVHPGQRAPRKP